MSTEEKKTIKIPGSEGEHHAQKKFGTTRRALAFYNNQMLNHLNAVMQEFIARQEMVFIATADARGECDCSFRAGSAGFVHVLDEKTLAFPEYRGNGVMASVGNISGNPHVGLIFIDFFQSTVGLHVNGEARVVECEDLLSRPDVTPHMTKATAITGGRRPERWIFVKVEEAYIHCSKHVPLLKKLDKDIHWGTDDETRKGGDFFRAKDCPRPWRRADARE